MAAWERDDSGGELVSENPQQRAIRHRAATLALIGLTVQEDGVAEGDEVAVELDAWYIGHALDAAEDDGLLGDVRLPPRS